MNNIQTMGITDTSVYSVEDSMSFEAITQEVTHSNEAPDDKDTTSSEETVGEEEIVDMILEQTFINEIIRQMKQDQQRLEEIFNEI